MSSSVSALPPRTELDLDVIVIGAGHAGTEAAVAAARLGARVGLVTSALETIGQMSCNPAIGGIAKGTVAREVDALGGVMGRATDLAMLQFRMLNRSKGPAVWAPRAQCDRGLYRRAVRSLLERHETLHTIQGTVARLLIDRDGRRVLGVETLEGRRFGAPAVVITAGTFLRGRIHIGTDRQVAGGRAGGPPIVELFNGTDLTGLTAYREPMTTLTTAQALEIFKVENGTIRVYGDKPATETQARHTLVTTKSYSKYKFWLEYKWGTKTYPPYANTAQYPRDAGVLFHLHGGTTKVWPPSAEFQIKDGSTGDIFALLAKMTSTGQGAVFTEGGAQITIDGSGGNARHARLANVDFELPEWNQILLEVNGGAATYTVNGKLANKVLAVTSTGGQAITSGPLALQAEHAEVFYRNIRIQELP